MIETSEGNFQAGYLFTEPVTDFESIKDLNQSMVEAGLCDPGAKSPTTRYGRLPFANNGKSDPAFQCKLTQWNPALRYTVAQIMDALALAPPKAKTSHKATPGRKAAAIDRNAEDGVYIPRPAENEVIGALKLRGLYKQPLGSGKHDVTCPWVHEHTDQIDHGSAYSEPTDLYPIGWFKCQHGHGDKYRTGALLEFLGVTFTAAKHKPTIKAEAGNIGSIADAGERELAATKRYYQRGGLIVSIATDPESRETAIKPVSQPALLRALSGCAIWTRYDARSDADVVIDPPPKHVNVLFDSEAYAHLYDTGADSPVQVINGVTAMEVPQADKVTIIKMHGDFKDPARCILGKAQYDQAYGEEQLDMDRPIPKMLRYHYSNNSLLFVGCSLKSDRTLQVFQGTKEQAGDKLFPQHFAIEQAPDQLEALVERNGELARLGITAIWYPKGQHNQVEAILRHARNELNHSRR